MHLHLETYLYFSDGSFLNQSSLNITHSSVYIIHHTKNTFCSHNKQLKKIAPLLSRTSPYHSLTLHNNLAVNISSSEHIFTHNFLWLHVDTNTSGSHRYSGLLPNSTTSIRVSISAQRLFQNYEFEFVNWSTPLQHVQL